MRHAEIEMGHVEEELPGWMADVLCDLQRAADDRELDGFACRIRQLRAHYPAGSTHERRSEPALC